MSRHALPPLQRKPSEYIRGPQYFQSIQLYEGEQSLRHAIEALGEDTLMFATDYPHSESWFPKSVDVVLGWGALSEGPRRSCCGRTPRDAMRGCEHTTVGTGFASPTTVTTWSWPPPSGARSMPERSRRADSADSSRGLTRFSPLR
jgi:hypothetical protein